MSIPFESVDNFGFAFGIPNDQYDRTVLVSALPEEATEKSVHIHFQKRRNGGGDVQTVILSTDGKALVVYEDPKVARRVVSTEQKYKENVLEVKGLWTEIKLNVAKTVLISGLPEGATESGVHVHFYKKKNGGGEVQTVVLLEEGKALVVFENSDVAKNVVATQQKFQRNVLQVKLLETETRGNDRETTEKAENPNQICGTVVGGDPNNQFEENLQCSVCQEALKDPRTLPCCHSFCKVCLEDVVKICRDKAPRDRRPIRQFPCPDCWTMFTLEPDKHIDDMPRNHFICNMVQVTAVLDHRTRVPCSHNCSQSFSVARCVTCEKFLCRECLTDHNKYRGHHNHSVLTMEELSKPENQTKIKGRMYCNEHSGMPLKVYCETCDKLICTDCMLFKHVKPNHSCFLVKDVASNYKKLLTSNNTAMENTLTEGNDFLERLSLMTVQLGDHAKNAKSEIAQRKDVMARKVVDMLDQKASSLINTVHEIHEGKRKKLDEQTEETKSYVEKIKQSVQLSKKLVEQGTEEEIVSSQKMMLDNANNLLRKRSEYVKATVQVIKVRYIPDTSKKLLNGDNVNSLGKIIEGDEDIGSNQAENKHGQSQTGNDQMNGSSLRSSTVFDQPTGFPTSAFDQSTQSKPPDKTFTVNSLFLRYILAHRYKEFEKLESVSKKISFKEKSKSEKDLKITAREKVDRETFLKTVSDFMDFYRREHQKMYQEDIKSQDDILGAGKKSSQVIDSTAEPNKSTIYSEKDKVPKAKSFLQSYANGSGNNNDFNDKTAKGTSAKGIMFSSNQPPKTFPLYSKVATGRNNGALRVPKSGIIDGTSKDDECCICLTGFMDKKTLNKCGHSFCRKCIDDAFKVRKQCPLCGTVYSPLTGDQPDGRMYDSYQSTSLLGFGSSGTIVITYRFPYGIQGPNHPNPGKPYEGTAKTAYLPNNEEGKKVLKLLKKAFDQKLTFTIGRSTKAGMEGVITWNGIHHKTSKYGGPTGDGYPDPGYLKRVQEELAAKGITE